MGSQVCRRRARSNAARSPCIIHGSGKEFELEIRQERAGEARAIHDVTDAAFATAEYSGGNEARIVDALREAGALTLSLVATDAGEIVGALSKLRGSRKPAWLAPPDQRG